MSPGRHDKSAVAEFVRGDFRQVWAVDRATGEPRFLPDGQAATLKEVAKRDWRCPVPGCDVQITTVGGSSQRHHFRHLQPSPHTSDGESEAHLAAKAMIADWAETQKPTGVVVSEEMRTEKHPETSRYRIADVMVGWPDGWRTAFEVEYKPYRPEDWARKQGDYDTDPTGPVATVWILGHTKAKRPRGGSFEAREPSAVRIPLLAQRWLQAGRMVLVINPSTREVGTLVASQVWDGLRYPDPNDSYGRLLIDPIDDCTLDPKLGIVTPTMLRVDADEAKREQARIAAEAQAARMAAARQSQQTRWQQIEAANTARWERSQIKRIVEDRWGAIPATLAKTAPNTHGIYALPVHWHTVLHEEHIHDNPEGHRFTIFDCWATLHRYGIDKNCTGSAAIKALVGFLEVLRVNKIITANRDHRGRISTLQVTGLRVGDPPPARLQRASAASHDRERMRRESAEAQDQQARRVHRDRLKADQEQRWLASTVRAEVLTAYAGTIPPAIAWLGGDMSSVIDATHAHWHALIYMKHIHRGRPGTVITPEDGHRTLTEARIRLVGTPADVETAVNAYLYNLAQRGILTRPADTGNRRYSLPAEIPKAPKTWAAWSPVDAPNLVPKPEPQQDRLF